MRHRIRRTLRQYGLELPFRGVICPRYVKTIEIDAAARVNVTVERTLVFLHAPAPGELCDVVPLADAEGEIHESPDSHEVHRTPGTKSTTVYWTPRDPITPYGLYVHKYGWRSPGYPAEAALYTEFRCDTRTGVALIEVKAPGTFEAAVAFRWPPWRRVRSVQSLVKHALNQLETSQGQQPERLDDGSRLRWTFVGPRVRERYACVAFHEQGVTLWQNRIEASSLPARMRRLRKAVTSF